MLGGHGKRKTGYVKIQQCAKLAVADDFEYVWVDTCCINKSSSAELSEAINSMYRWYQNAGRCYAYLTDVPNDSGPQKVQSAMRASRWFTRGWTLQELIAPKHLVFYATDWTELDTKSTWKHLIFEITGVDVKVLDGAEPGTISVARRMSWASRRRTTRIEDLAYCLLGLFDVNMPMLYGEGIKAFLRLQEEIMKTSDDHSLFAWTASEDSGTIYRGLLAESPAEFANSGAFVPIRTWAETSPYSMTNKGLHISLPLAPLSRHKENNIYLAGLDCKTYSGARNVETQTQLGWRCWIYMRELAPGTGQFARCWSEHIKLKPLKFEVESVPQSVQVRQKTVLPEPDDRALTHGFLITNAEYNPDWRIHEVFPNDRWNEYDQTLQLVPEANRKAMEDGELNFKSPETRASGAISYSTRSGKRFVVLLEVAIEAKTGGHVPVMMGRWNHSARVVPYPTKNPSLQELCESFHDHKLKHSTAEVRADGRRVTVEVKEQLIQGQPMFVVRLDTVCFD